MTAMALLKASLVQTFRLNQLTRANKGRRGRAFGLAALLAFAGVSAFSTLGMVFWGVASVLAPIGELRALIHAAFAMASLGCLIFCAAQAQGYLFSFRDFDILSSMPIKASHILASKIALLYVCEALASYAIMLPATIVYGAFAKAGAMFYVVAALASLFVPVVPMLAGAAIGFLVMRVSSGARRVGPAATVLAFAAVIAVFLLSFALPRLAESPGRVGGAISGFAGYVARYPLASMFEGALRPDLPTAALFALVNAALLALFAALLSRVFRSINARLAETSSRADYRMRPLAVAAPMRALYVKELRNYFASAPYVLNTAMGVVLMLLYTVAVIFLGPVEVTTALGYPGAAELMLPFTALISCVCVVLTNTAAVSISVEGSRLWIVKAMPVSFSSIAASKALLNLTVTVPAIAINAAIVASALSLSPAQAASLLLPALAYAAFAPAAGLLCNLFLPKLTWTTQTQAVKQSASVIVMMLAMAVAIAVPALLFAVLGPWPFTQFSAAVSAAVFAAAAATWRAVLTVGRRLFERILD